MIVLALCIAAWGLMRGIQHRDMACLFIFVIWVAAALKMGGFF